MKVKIKKLHPDAVIPSYANIGDAGLDLTAVEDFDIVGSRTIEYRTGLAIQIPTGFVGLIFPRSSISNKGLILSNSVGVIDSGYTGEIKFRFRHDYTGTNVYQKGDRIGQLIIIPYPAIQFQEVDELGDTERGIKGFGSSGI